MSVVFKGLDRHHGLKHEIEERLKKYRPKVIGEYEENGRKIVVYESRPASAPGISKEIRWE